MVERQRMTKGERDRERLREKEREKYYVVLIV